MLHRKKFYVANLGTIEHVRNANETNICSELNKNLEIKSGTCYPEEQKFTKTRMFHNAKYNTENKVDIQKYREIRIISWNIKSEIQNR